MAESRGERAGAQGGRRQVEAQGTGAQVGREAGEQVAAELWAELQALAEDLRAQGWEADASRSRNVAEQVAYLSVVVRIRDEGQG